MLRRIISIRSTTRSLNTSTSAFVGDVIRDSDGLDSFFKESSWSTRELLQTTNEVIDNTILDGLLDLSGLSKNISPDEKRSILASLKSQVNFIGKLDEASVQNHNNSTTRLVDDKSVEVFDLESLLKSSNEITPEVSKGEIENSWNPLSLASESQNKYFIVREGLEKKNK